MCAPRARFALSRRSRMPGTVVRAMERRELGQIGETLAASYLATRGWQIVDRNVRFREGEIDIVASRGGILAFVEVKTRRSAAFGSPAEAVTWRKQRRIRALATRYLSERHPRGRPVPVPRLAIARR